MKSIQIELQTEKETRELFFQIIFDKMHLRLDNIKAETFAHAEQNIQFLLSLLDYEGAAEAFVNSN